VDVVLEEVVELIGKGVDCAVYCLGNTIAERKRGRRFFACWEGDELEFSKIVGYLNAVRRGICGDLSELEIVAFEEAGARVHVRRSH